MSVGFEFQTNINVYRPDPTLLGLLDTSFGKARSFWNKSFVNELPALCVDGQSKSQLTSHPKGTTLYTGNGWQLTADATDCEFVTDPIPVDCTFDKADALFPGEERLVVQFDAMVGFCTRLDAFIRGRKTAWIYSEELGLTTFPKSVLFVQKGPSNIMAFPQISGGIRLARLRKLFRHFAKNNNTEAASLLLGEGVSQTYAVTLGTVATALTASVIKDCVKAAGWNGHEPSSKLRGLLTYVAFYLRKGSDEYPAKVAKQFFFIMSRTDFAKLFDMLPSAEKKHYHDAPDEWVDLCCRRIYGKVKNGGLDPNGKVINQKINDYGELQTPVQIPITRKQWLVGMTTGTDLISSGAHPKGTDDATYIDVNGNHRLRGLGGLGDAVDNIVTKDLTGRAPVFEFRGPTFSTARFPYTEWKAYAQKCFRFLYAINVHEKKEKISESTIMSLSG